MQLIVDTELPRAARWAATHLRLYRKIRQRDLPAFEHRRTVEPGAAQRLLAVRQLLRQGRDHWRALAAAADGNYADDLVFGFRQKGHCGHWKDDLTVIESDLATVDQIMAAVERHPADQAQPLTSLSALFPGGDIHPHPPDVVFSPPARAPAGRDLILRIRCDSSTPLRAARCYHRIAHQALPFDVIDMRADTAGYTAALPGDFIDPAWDLMLFFEFELANGSATRWPDWRIQTPYFVIPTQ